MSAPDTVSFSDSADPATNVTLGGTAGLYTLALTGDDTGLSPTDEVSIMVYDTTITVDADAEVQFGGGLNGNFGTVERMEVRNPSSGNREKVYLRFDVSSLSQAVEAAALDVNITGIPGNVGLINDYNFLVYGLEERFDYGYRRLGEDWQEGVCLTLLIIRITY